MNHGTWCLIAVVALALLNASGTEATSKADFDPETFRADAASIVSQMSQYLFVARLLVMSKLQEYSLGKQATGIVDKFFDTLPDYTANCDHPRPRNAIQRSDDYTVQEFFSDLSEHLDPISSHYQQLRENGDNSLITEKKCLSEHVITFVVDNKEVAKQILKFIQIAKNIRDEL